MFTNDTRVKNLSLAVFLVVLAAALVWMVAEPLSRWSNSLTPSRTISVSAEGKTVVRPDVAKVSFSVVSEGQDPQALTDENNKAMSEAIDFVKSKGIAANDVKTAEYNLAPGYGYDMNRRRSVITGYAMTQTALVTIRDLDKVAAVVGGLSEYGVNQIGAVSFEVEDREKYLGEARDKAFLRAQEKAKEMAEKNGVRLGRVISFSEYQGTPPIPYYETLGRGGMGANTAQSVTPSVEPGSQEVKVQVSVTYELR